MRIAFVGCGLALYRSILSLGEIGHEIVSVVSPEPPSYTLGDTEALRELARRWGAEFHLLAGEEKKTLGETLGLDLDLAISMYWPWRIPSAVLRKTRLGFLNIHSGDLPRYRGNACPTWAVLNGEKVQGLAAHLMDEGLDTGPIVEKRHLELTEESSVSDIFLWVNDSTPALVVSSVEKLESSQPLTPQEELEVPVLRTFPRREEDMRIRWSESTESILRLMRASSSPLEGAWTTVASGGEKLVLRIWAGYEESSPFQYCAVPGQVFEISGNGFTVVTGDGLIRVHSFSCESSGRKAIWSLRQRLE